MERKYLEYFDGAFDSTVAEKIQPENKPYVAYSKTEGVVYTIIPEEDGVYYGIKCLEQRPIVETTYEEVDLGLSVKWANKNIGAETPQDNGYYFSWGSTTPNSVCLVDGGVPQDELIKAYLYDNDSYSYDDMTPELIQGVKDQYGDNLESELKTYFNDSYGADTWGIISNYIFGWKNTPYCTVDEDGNPVFSKYNGTNGDGLTKLEATDDTARVIMGGDWRMPTSAETLELVQGTDQYYIDLSGHTVAKSELDGSQLRSICFVKKGEEFNYNNRSNFIEFPFAGSCFGSLLRDDGLDGYVWSSSVVDGNAHSARDLYFNSSGKLRGDSSRNRFYGQSVRGVHA